MSHGGAATLAAAFESAASFLAAHRPELCRQQQKEQPPATAGEEAAAGRDRQWSDWEWRLLRRAQRRLLGVVEGCRLAAAVEAAKNSSHLSLKVGGGGWVGCLRRQALGGLLRALS